MTKFQVIFFSLWAFSIGDSNISDNGCRDWKPYRDEKCVKIFEESGLYNYENAADFCKNHEESHLILIDSEQKQNFVENLLKFNKIVDNIWIGLRHGNTTYEWNIGTELHYANWKKDNPKNGSDFCVHVNADETEFGKWSSVPCNKKNVVVCEKNQELSWIELPARVIKLHKALNESEQTVEKLEATVSQLQKELQQLQNELEKSRADLSAQLQNELRELREEVKKSLTDLLSQNKQLEEKISGAAKNNIPIGFVYAQLPDEKSPEMIWPSMVWKDISSSYAGLFFRVLGGNSAVFGLRQSEHSPRLIKVQRHYGQGSHQSVNVFADGYRSDIIDADDVSIGSSQGLSFTVSSGEVRPVNKAIKIWKRIR